MPGLKRTTMGSGDQRWLASAHGTTNARSGVLDVSTFTAGTHYPDGYFPSGLPANVVNEGSIKPWTGATGEHLGYVLFDNTTDGAEDVNVAYIKHGTVNTAYLPVAHVAPAAGAVANGFVFIGGSN